MKLGVFPDKLTFGVDAREFKVAAWVVLGGTFHEVLESRFRVTLAYRGHALVMHQT